MRDRLEQRRRSGFFRAPIEASGLIDLGGNDYLGLRRDARVVEASSQAARDEGVGAGASRLAGGSLERHRETERNFAEFKAAGAAAIFPTGYMANIAALTALIQPGDLILCDKRNHASILDAAALCAKRRGSPGATVRAFPHRDTQRAKAIAERFLERAPDAAVWLVSDSVFSMDGDTADLAGLGSLRDALADRAGGGACLILDEAHATGVLGPTGAGLDESAGHLADVVVSTASKALGGLGGIVTGPSEAIEAIHNFARPFIYSTAVPPPQLAAINAAVRIVRDEPHRRERLHEHARRARAALAEKGWSVRSHETDPTPIVPLIVGEPERAAALSNRLRKAGFFAPAIRPPSVPPRTSRVRLSLRADLTDEQVDRLIEAVPRYDAVPSGVETSHGDVEG